MRPRWRTPGSGLLRSSRALWFVTACAVGVPVALVISALSVQTTRVYAYSVGSIVPLTTLKPGERICQGPIVPQGAFRTAVFINSGTHVRARLTVHAGSSAAAPAIALGELETLTPAEGENAVLLTASVPPISPLTICLREQSGVMTLYGGGSQIGTSAIAGTNPATTLWLELLSAKPHSFLDALGLAFRRAALFRPGWVGAWTFWALLVLLFAGFPAMVMAVASAGRDESGQSNDDDRAESRSPREHPS